MFVPELRLVLSEESLAELRSVGWNRSSDEWTDVVFAKVKKKGNSKGRMAMAMIEWVSGLITMK